jgi:hypothetical protein
MAEKYEWQYKDGNRDWWCVSARKSGERPTGFDDGVDFVWSYEIKREKVIIHTNEIVGQYNEPPSLQDVLEDFTCYISGVAIGFSRYGDVD